MIGLRRFLATTLLACATAHAGPASPLLQYAAAHPAPADAAQRRIDDSRARLPELEAQLERLAKPRVGVSSAGADVFETPPDILAAGYDQKGYHLAILERREDAIAAWHEALRLAPQELRYWSDIGSELERLARDGEAEDAFAKAIAGDEPDAQALQAAAAHHLGSAQWQRVVDLARRKASPESSADDTAYLELYAIIAARALGADPAEFAPLDADDSWTGALAAFALGESDESALLAKIEASGGSDANDRLCEALFYAGALAEARGERDAAVAYYRATLARGVRAFVEHVHAERALRRLAAPG
ncbi:MAG TPA: hypothetical protein VFL14_00310 [Xanthomonadales bacterium]|nr:hypothetical protein [Xanthomonadales bacterium]